MSLTSLNLIQMIAPATVLGLLIVASGFFYVRYVKVSKILCTQLERVGVTVRTMADGEESMRESGVAKVFQGTDLEPIWREFSKTLHYKISYVNGVAQQRRLRITAPAAYFFSPAAVVDRPLGVEYFRHLPGILTGIGIIGTFSGILFGLSNFDSTDSETMSSSVTLLLYGVRDAFFASAAAITAAMAITHWEKLLYRRCLAALDILVESLSGLFEAGVGEEYLAELVANSKQSTDQVLNARHDLVQTMAPLIRQLENIQGQQIEGLGQILESVLSESNRRLVDQFESALNRQVRVPLDELAQALEGRLGLNTGNPQNMALKVLRARQRTEGDNEPKPELV